MRVYRRKVDNANADRAQLRQSLMAKEAELKALVTSIGENTPQFKVYILPRPLVLPFVQSFEPMNE